MFIIGETEPNGQFKVVDSFDNVIGEPFLKGSFEGDKKISSNSPSASAYGIDPTRGPFGGPEKRAAGPFVTELLGLAASRSGRAGDLAQCDRPSRRCDGARFASKAIVSTNVKEQVELIGKLADTESEIVPTVLNAWRDGKVFIHETPEGQKIPFFRTDGKSTRIDDGNPIEASETTAVDTTSKLRRAMKNTLDVLTIAGPDPQGRRAAITKLGNDSERGLSANLRGTTCCGERSIGINIS